jgi:hypothetical protein
MTAKRCLGEADAICAPYATGRHYQERPPPETGDFKDERFRTYVSEPRRQTFNVYGGVC